MFRTPEDGRELFDEGMRLYNAGEYFEAHEVWEELWADDVSDARELYQGLIQAAAGFFKLEQGVPAGTVKLMARCLPLLQMYPADYLGLDLGAFRQALGDCRREAQRLLDGEIERFDGSLIPRLERPGSS